MKEGLSRSLLSWFARDAFIPLSLISMFAVPIYFYDHELLQASGLSSYVWYHYHIVLAFFFVVITAITLFLETIQPVNAAWNIGVAVRDPWLWGKTAFNSFGVQLIHPYLTIPYMPTASLCPKSISHPVAIFMFAWSAAEMAFYAVHASHHWRDSKMHTMHKKHHSSRVLNFFDAGTNWHSLDWWLDNIAYVVAFHICCPAEHRYFFQLILACVYAHVGSLGHANIETNTPLCDAIFATPRVHHVHHQGGKFNFCFTFMLWDHVFGTYRRVLPGKERIHDRRRTDCVTAWLGLRSHL